tara:strand:+ start:4819 stop:5049 length:231 start_codon:yes stop_codon:yes gene_type:complete
VKKSKIEELPKKRFDGRLYFFFLNKNIGKAIAAINAIIPVESSISLNSIPKNSGMQEACGVQVVPVQKQRLSVTPV